MFGDIQFTSCYSIIDINSHLILYCLYVHMIVLSESFKRPPAKAVRRLTYIWRVWPLMLTWARNGCMRCKHVEVDFIQRSTDWGQSFFDRNMSSLLYSSSNQVYSDYYFVLVYISKGSSYIWVSVTPSQYLGTLERKPPRPLNYVTRSHRQGYCQRTPLSRVLMCWWASYWHTLSRECAPLRMGTKLWLIVTATRQLSAKTLCSSQSQVCEDSYFQLELQVITPLQGLEESSQTKVESRQ